MNPFPPSRFLSAAQAQDEEILEDEEFIEEEYIEEEGFEDKESLEEEEYTEVEDPLFTDPDQLYELDDNPWLGLFHCQ